MNIHEYQATGLMAKHGVAVPRGAVAYTAAEAEAEAVAVAGITGAWYQSLSSEIAPKCRFGSMRSCNTRTISISPARMMR